MKDFVQINYVDIDENGYPMPYDEAGYSGI